SFFSNIEREITNDRTVTQKHHHSVFQSRNRYCSQTGSSSPRNSVQCRTTSYQQDTRRKTSIRTQCHRWFLFPLIHVFRRPQSLWSFFLTHIRRHPHAYTHTYTCTRIDASAATTP